MTGQGFDTTLPACSLEFCPSPGQEQIFVVGTYKLDDTAAVPTSAVEDEAPKAPDAQSRHGECLVFEVTTLSNEEEDAPSLSVSLCTHTGAAMDSSIAVVKSLPSICLRFWT
jgi:diphthamide biosynthesis protein 7